MTLGSGPTKTSIIGAIGLQVDFPFVRPNQLGAALMYFTGSKAHNIKLRQLAMDRGWILNEYALAHAETGEIIASEHGLGQTLSVLAASFKTNGVFGVIILLALIGVAITWGMTWLENRLLRWR